MQQAKSTVRTGATNSEVDPGVVKFFSPENEDFPYDKVYLPLNTAGDGGTGCDFRVVRILPGLGDDTIRCQLLPSKLSSDRKYEALSYCAGAASDCCRILLHGYPFNTFRSTYEAIRRFRHCQEDVVMWIDQICINQTDIGERDSQVMLMGDIYKRAARTQIWLGESASDPPTWLAFALLRDFVVDNRAILHQHITNTATSQTGWPFDAATLKRYPWAEDAWWRYYNVTQTQLWQRRQVEARKDPTLLKVYQWFCTACKDPGRGISWDTLSYPFTRPWWRRRRLPKTWNAFFDLFERPWWKRCWIVQEAVMSKHLVVNCGRNRISWEDLSLFLSVWHVCVLMWNTNTFEEDDLTTSMRSCFELFYNINSRRICPTAVTLQSCLSFLRHSLASDPRDKVYSVLGMLEPKQRQDYALFPSYKSSHTVINVYTTAAIAILSVDRDLMLPADINGLEPGGELPTWVPDWSRPLVSFFSTASQNFNAGSSRPVELEVLKDKCQLKLRGYLVDSIKTIGPADSDDTLEVLTTWQSLVVQTMQHENDLHLLNAFYRTLALDCWTTETGDPSGDPTQFRTVWDRALAHQFSTRTRKGNRFFMSKGSAPGMATMCAQENDEVFIPWGSSMPIAVRRLSQQGDRFQLIGPCYLHGMMYGEVLSLEEEDKIECEDIYLI